MEKGVFWHLKARIRGMKRLLKSCAGAIWPWLEPHTSALVSLDLWPGVGASPACALRRTPGLSKIPVAVSFGRVARVHGPPERSEKCGLCGNSAVQVLLRRTCISDTD